eukprot:6031473-Amphidinium_carterae.4
MTAADSGNKTAEEESKCMTASQPVPGGKPDTAQPQARWLDRVASRPGRARAEEGGRPTLANQPSQLQSLESRLASAIPLSLLVCWHAEAARQKDIWIRGQ